MKKLQERKAVVEERIMEKSSGAPACSFASRPWVRLNCYPHMISFSVAVGQSYLGCVFPADKGYAALITREAAKVGRRLAKEGVIGRFALDFVVVRSNGKWEPYAIEINLRKADHSSVFDPAISYRRNIRP